MLSANRGHRVGCDNIDEIVREMLLVTTSERQGRVIDFDGGAGMEEKKREGYF